MPIQKPEFFSGVSAPVEKREKLAVKYDDPLWWEKDNELIKTEFGRLALQSRRRVTFEGGYCDQDHPLQAYANELAKLLPQLEDCRVIVSPFDPSCNACALPDGTFFVTPKLFVRAKTKEAILGVILHEWIHFKREHSKANYDKRRQPSNVDKKDEDYTKARSVMEGISAGRLHEYIADIQGAVIELDKLGFSPLGYKEFLEDLAKREGSSGGGMVHGSSQERVLNITELLASIHLPSTNNPTQLLDGRVTAWVAEKRGIHGFPALHEEMSLVKGTKAKDLMDQQMLEIAGMPLCLVPEALEKRWRELSGRSVFAAVERKSRAFHECFLPPLQALGHRLSSALLEEETVGKKSDESFASDLAASAMYAPHTLLPESDTKGVWHYMRAEFPFIQFRASGIPVFLATAEKLVYEKPGLEKGLFTRRMPLRGVYSDWMVSNFPAVPDTVDDCVRWWKLV